MIYLLKNKKLLMCLILFTVWLYGAWALYHLLIEPAIKGMTDNEYVRVLLRDGVIKSLVWTLPAVLLIRRFSSDMLIGMRQLFSFRKAALKYLLIAVPLAAFVLIAPLLRGKGINISPTFHPSKLITVLFVGFTEEIVFRGLYLNASLKGADTNAKKYTAVGVNALMFLVIHFPIWISTGTFTANFASFAFVTIIALSVLFSFCTINCRNIWVASILHSFYDMLVFVFV